MPGLAVVEGAALMSPAISDLPRACSSLTDRARNLLQQLNLGKNDRKQPPDLAGHAKLQGKQGKERLYLGEPIRDAITTGFACRDLAALG